MLPLLDNLSVIKGSLKANSREFVRIEEMVKNEKLLISPLAYIRGRSLSKVFFIVDESQNLTPHEVKTIITRAGEGSKLVSPDIYQIDQPYLDMHSNGLTYLTDKMLGQELFAHVNLVRGNGADWPIWREHIVTFIIFAAPNPIIFNLLTLYIFMSEIKRVYSFGGKTADGDGSMKSAGGKGANLAEMCLLGIPVPAGFTITTECCTESYALGCNYPKGLAGEVAQALMKAEDVMGARFGDPENPLLVSCRSGARSSMPGMMETVLNIGLCSATIPGLIKKTNNPRFVYDAYRRLIMMFSDVVMEKAEGIEPAEGQGIRVQLDALLHEMKVEKGYKSDTDLTEEDLITLCDMFKKRVVKVLGKPFPDDAMEQLWGGIGAVFKSWNGKRAISYRRIEGIPDEWGTAVTVQSMVFGNMGDNSATGVAFSRNPATGEAKFYGEWLINAQGEDVVAGIRTPNP